MPELSRLGPRLNIIFMGTPTLACASLKALTAAPGFEVSAVVTQPDRPKGRELRLQPSPVKELAMTLKLPTLQPERARDPVFIRQIQALKPDLIAVTAFGQILPRSLLETPRLGCLNVHTSLLPRYRGAAPIQRAILNDDAETGVTIMKIDAGLDTGDILTQERISILPSDTSESLHNHLATIGADLLVRTIRDYAAGRVRPVPQSTEGVVMAPKIRKEEGLVDWTRPARQIWNQVRGLRPWPGAFTYLARPERHFLKIWESEVEDRTGEAGVVLRADKGGIVVGCGLHALKVTALQREGGRRLTAQEFLAGNPLVAGDKMG